MVLTTIEGEVCANGRRDSRRSEVGEMGWRLQEHWQFRETPTALVGLRHAEVYT